MTSPLRLLAATAAFCLAPAAWAGNPTTDFCAGRSQASCQAPGLVEKPRITLSKGVLGAAEGKQLITRVEKMLEVALRAPPLHEPRGMSLHPAISVGAPPDHAAKHHPVLVRTTVLALPIHLEDKQSVQDKKTGAWKGTGEGPLLHLHFNDLGAFLSNATLDLSNPDEFLNAPQKVAEVRGFPVYAVGGKEVLLISKRDALPWQPFPVERYFQLRISETKKGLAEAQEELASADEATKPYLEKANAERRALLGALEKELSQLSPAQRQAGACQSARFQRGRATDLDFTCAPGSTPLAVLNQDVFTRSAPKGSLQFLTLTTTWGVIPKDDRMPNAVGQAVRAALQNMDLKALQAMLD